MTMLFLEYLFLWYLFYSFCGWVYESILVSVQQRRPVNRGFLNGPLCPIYGTGAVLAVVVFGGQRNPVVVFLVSSVGACILEYFTSWAMEKLFHARWWDYSHFRFNLNGRICLLGAIVFGVGGVAIVDVVQPQVARVTAMIPLVMIHVMCAVFLVAITVDAVVTVVGIVDFEKSLERFQTAVAKYGDAFDEMREKVGDAMGEATDRAAELAAGVAAGANERLGGVPGKVGEKVGQTVGGTWHSGREMSTELMLRIRETAGKAFNRQQRRMIASFPRLKATRNDEALQQLREAFEKLRRNGR
ncbi:transporter [Bifidobacterium parmae]|uniref:Transporter n=2 Tax=Bifidobacterium parmae TaxID=361854 RepID=A0A2N5J5L6_9BIFI|nr:transporter [Bifidobacterium parmae]